jgi:hypothetical protein
VWNLWDVKLSDRSTAYQVTLLVKLFVVAASAIAAWAHANTKTRLVLIVGGAVSGLGGLVSLFLGILLKTGH